ncbi:putative glycoside hydrolase family 18 protein [Rosellinia necatrix]|uniref:chitinase n=1 Tax=Rosellinia necatrix TaxID=77044 RepID=A0A1W2TVG0_ROSNE|nr:putative glycoside hydrolase family 18 protein [Rosellinia necatrix]
MLILIFLLTGCGISRAQPHSEKDSSRPTQVGCSAVPRNSSTPLRALYQPYSSNIPVFQNDSINQLRSDNPGRRSDQLNSDSINRRQFATPPEGTCAPGLLCQNGVCCSNTGVSSFAPPSCGTDVCLFNCDAKAPCRQYVDSDSAICSLSACFSQDGFCGSIEKPCGTGCQEGFGGYGPVPTPSCPKGSNSVNSRRVGYYESWATTRPCDVVEPEDLRLAGLTHINFAFVFFDPSSFHITPMDANSASLFARFTALKRKQPGLQTWISVGGWSFNDATNTPNTQNGFSDMVASAANRRAFIISLRNFMQTYGFDGVDIDWEYPVVDDRGGRATDFDNFPVFLAELRASFGSGLGISVTLPSTYGYLHHFKLLEMEPSLDWFNLISYDIHGVWDLADKFTGPYIRPHSNLTEIEDSLSLLWRAGVDPSKVVLGLGWYGRSFTLEDPDCHVPNGVCRFSSGGNEGECSRSSGTLTNAEIKRILETGTAVESYDADAAVRWMRWDTDQWASYDDGVTMQQKIAKANSLCLGGIMIWALDQDNAAGESMNDLLEIGKANGVSELAAESYKEQLASATLQQAIASSCYWSLCGESCAAGYFSVTEARGQVGGIRKNLICTGSELQMLCCASGTAMGTCAWEGFRGVGFPCSPTCSDPTATIIARNSNSYGVNDGDQAIDLTCTGGYQVYCCTDFIPSPIINPGSFVLYGQRDQDINSPGSRNDNQEHGLAVRKRGGAPPLPASLGALCPEEVGPLVGPAPLAFGLTEGLMCAATAISLAAFGFEITSVPVNWHFTGSPRRLNTDTPITIGGRTSDDQWPAVGFGTTTSCDCGVAWKCRNALVWDGVCGN